MLNPTAKAAIAGLLLASGAAAPAAIAMERPAGLTEMMGIYILSQGNEALLQIREDMKKDLLAHLKPLLPKPEVVVPDQAPAPAAQTPSP